MINKSLSEGFEAPANLLDLAQQGRLGLLGMQERAEALGGQLELQSNPGEGTRVVAIIPLSPLRKVE